MPVRVPSANMLRSLPAVRFATQAATKPSPTTAKLPKREPKITTLPNGIVVASVENYSPVAYVSVSLKAGSRYEDGSNLGTTHILRNSAGLSTKDATLIGITRSIQQIGGNLTATSTRDHLSYNLECVRDDLEVGLPFLSQVVTKQAFKPWEIKDILPRVKLDLASYRDQPHLIVLEELHKAAFRTGLGNSLFSPDYMIGEHESETLQDYVQKNFTSHRAAVVGVGICHEYLKEYVTKNIQLPGGTDQAAPTKYGGGEIRISTGNPLSYVAVATEGASLKNKKDVLSLAVLQSILGAGTNIKYGESLANKLAQVASKATEGPFAISALNVNHSDSGLFGFYCVSQPADSAKILKAVFSFYSSITKSGLSNEDVNRAKNHVKATIGIAQESSSQLSEEFAVQALVDGQLTSTEEIFKLVDSLTAADISTVAKKVINGKPSLAAVGNLSNTPYLDQLL